MRRHAHAVARAAAIARKLLPSFGLLTIVALVPPSAALAGRIRGRADLGPRTTDPGVERYFAAALRSRSLDVRVPRGMRVVASAEGLLDDSSFVNYLRWRRSLNPNRFDQFHARMGPMLLRDLQVRNRPIVPALPPLVPDDPITIGGRPTGPPTTQTVVPEPSTALAAMVIVGGWGLWRRRSRAA